VLVTGYGVISGNTMTFKKEVGPAACTGSQAVGRYIWSLTGKSLTFRRVHDTCLGRRTVLAGRLTRSS
jgi:hypothetical protein